MSDKILYFTPPAPGTPFSEISKRTSVLKFQGRHAEIHLVPLFGIKRNLCFSRAFEKKKKKWGGKVFNAFFLCVCLADTVHLSDAGSAGGVSVELRDKDHQVLQQGPRLHLPPLETQGTAGKKNKKIKK